MYKKYKKKYKKKYGKGRGRKRFLRKWGSKRKFKSFRKRVKAVVTQMAEKKTYFYVSAGVDDFTQPYLISPSSILKAIVQGSDEH